MWKNITKSFDGSSGTTNLNLLQTFPLFGPYSSGKYKEKSYLTIQTINQIIPFLSSLGASVGRRQVTITPITDFPTSSEDTQASAELKFFFDRHGSDKANLHNYHHFYGPILKNREGILGVFEIGMGTNNTDVVSNMGTQGKPGASLRAFRDFLPNAKIYGADLDTRILFEEERIKTFFVDQTDPASFTKLKQSIPSDLDLVIDDGLHAPNANIATLNFALTKIKIGGWVVVEDIVNDAIPVWEVVSALLPDNFQPYLFKTKYNMFFAVKRLN